MLKEPILRRNRIACLGSHGYCRSVSQQPGDTMLSPKPMDWKSTQCSYHQNNVICAQKPKGRLYPVKGSPQPVMYQPKRYTCQRWQAVLKAKATTERHKCKQLGRWVGQGMQIY
jgi:hypothetical protein